MAKLPGPADLGTRPTPRVGGGVVGYRVPDIGGGAQVAQAQAGVGTAFEQAGADIYQGQKYVEQKQKQIAHEAKVESDRINTIRAEEAFTKLREQQLDLTAGQKNGYENLKGAQAVTQPVLEQWTKKFNDAADQIAGGLVNDQQRELFKRRAAVASLQYREGILRHVVRENDVYSKQVLDGTITTETRAATAQWQDPNAVALSLERVNAAIKTQAQRNSWAPEFTDAARLKAAGQIHSAVVSQALASGEYEYAQKWYQDHAADVDKPTAVQLQAAVRDGTQRQLSAAYNGQFLAARDDQTGLRALEKTVLSDGTLDEQHRNALLGRIQSRAEILASRADREQARRERMVEQGINAINAVTLAGFEPSVEQMTPLITAARGTALEPQVKRMIDTANATRQFRLATPQQQEVYLNQMEAQARQAPGKFDVTTLSHFRTIYQNQQKAVAEDPTSFAVRQGLIEPTDPAAKPLDLTKPSELGTSLQARFDLGRAIGQRYGAPFKPLTKEETDLLTATLKHATVDQRRNYFAALSQASGSDFDGYKAMMAQIAPDDPVTAAAGIAAGRGKQVTDVGLAAEPGKATRVADLILTGQAALNPKRKEDGTPENGKLWPMPPETDLSKTFRSNERDAFQGRPEARNGFYQTARAIYAGLSIQAGDASGVLDASRWENAIKLSTGGIEKYNGKYTLMPWGNTKGQFKDGLKRRVEDIASQGRLAPGMDVGKITDLPVEPVGDGKYVFRAGDGVLVDKSNRPIVIDFNQPVMWRPSGYKP